MTDFYRNKYRIPPARAQWWDYKDNAAYFITICTADRQPYFGEIVSNEMQLSEIGKIVETEWQKTADLRPDMNLILDKFVVMPNHIHAIIIIGKNEFNENNDENQLQQNDFIPQQKICRQLYADINRQCQNIVKNYRLILRGRHVFTTALYAILTNITVLQNT